MPETSLFFDAVIAARAVKLDAETALMGNTTVSLETQDMAESDVLTYIENNFPDFIRNLRYLSKEDQETLLSYYILSKTQTAIANLQRSTQTLCSSKIRLAMRKMCTVIICGSPTPELLKEVFEGAGIEHPAGLNVPLSEIVSLYSKTRSFQRVAELLSVHRPEVRRVMSAAAKTLSKSNDRRDKAIGAYVSDLIDKASASGQGFSRRKLAKQGAVHVKTPDILGEFRISVTDPAFDQIFVSRANR